jgi:hypothetical protein
MKAAWAEAAICSRITLEEKTMGSNRAGANAKLRKRRRRREEERLAAKHASQEQHEGILDKVKDVAAAAAHTVGSAVKVAAKKVKRAVT